MFNAVVNQTFAPEPKIHLTSGKELPTAGAS
jgi:hypothetical protein